MVNMAFLEESRGEEEDEKRRTRRGRHGDDGVLVGGRGEKGECCRGGCRHCGYWKGENCHRKHFEGKVVICTI